MSSAGRPLILRHGDKRLDALLALAAGSQSPAPVVEPLPFYVDPSNVTGHANDSNPGTADLPIKTVAALNARFAGRIIDAAVTVTFLSNVTNTDVLLDVATASLTNNGSITFQGTPQILHTGTLTAGTVTIDPSSQQRQILEDTALGVNGWAPFEGKLLRITAGPNAGTTCNIVRHVNGTSMAVADRPMTASLAAGAVASGNAYEIEGGSTLGVLSADVINAFPTQGIAFSDFTLEGTTVINGQGIAQLIRCKLMLPFNNAAEICLLDGCWIGAGFIGSATTAGVSFGTIVIPEAPPQQAAAILFLNSDVYVTGIGALVGPDSYQYLIVSNGTGEGIGGAQFQDTTSPLGAIVVEVGGQVVGAGQVAGLLWGTGNAGAGVVAGPGATIEVGTSIDTPTVTGTAGDFAFTAPTSSALVSVGRAWNDGTGVYTANIATTWANLVAAIGSGGFGGAAHSNTTNSHVIQGVL